MPDNDLTEIILVVDRSGSMASIQADASGGLNNFIKEQREMPGRANVTLVQFDTVYEKLLDNVPIQRVDKYKLEPRGATALLDAMGRTIIDVGTRLHHTPEHQRPGKVVMVIVTDGEENSSREFAKEKVFEMVRHQQEKYQWQFIFLAANQDAIQVAHTYGIMHASNFAPTGMGVNCAYSVSSNAVRQYRTSGNISQLPVDADGTDDSVQSSTTITTNP